jgi:hypothetical protein
MTIRELFRKQKYGILDAYKNKKNHFIFCFCPNECSLAALVGKTKE